MAIYTNNKFNKKFNTPKNNFYAGCSFIVIFSLLLILLAFNAIHPLTSFMLGTFGLSCYAICVFFIAYGTMLILNVKRNISVKSIILISFSLLFFICILHLATTLKLENLNYKDYLISCYNNKLTAGGLITGIVVYPVLHFTYNVASFIIFSVILLFLLGGSITSIIYDCSLNKTFGKNNKSNKTSNTKNEELKPAYTETFEEAKDKMENMQSENLSSQDSIFISDEDVNYENTEKEIDIETIKQMNKEKARAILWPDKFKNAEEIEKDEPEKPLTPKEILFPNSYKQEEQTSNLNSNYDYSSYISTNNPSKPKIFIHSNDDEQIISANNSKQKELTENERKNLEFLRSSKGQFTINKPTAKFDNFNNESKLQENLEETNNNIDDFINNVNFQTEEVNSDIYDENLTKQNFKEKYYNEDIKLENEETSTGLTNLSGYTERTVKNSALDDDQTNDMFFEHNFREVDGKKKPDYTNMSNNFSNNNFVNIEEAKPIIKPDKQQNGFSQKRITKSRPYKKPPTNLLNYIENNDNSKEDYSVKAALLEQTLDSFKIPAKVVSIVKGPAVTRFELAIPPNQGISVKRVTNYVDDIAMVLQAQGSIRVETPIPGKNAFGIEVPNKKVAAVSMRDVIESKEFTQSASPLTVGLGKNITNNFVTTKMDKMTHLLVAGTTGSGKSVCLNVMLISWLYKASPDELKLLLIDPKQVEFNLYSGLPHLLIPNIITDIDKAIKALSWAIDEMERRFQIFKNYFVRNITEYNERPEVKSKMQPKMPFIIIVVDEYGDIMVQNKKDVEAKIIRITQKARAAGIHLVIATQRPSVDVITGIIKTNLPSRMAFKVQSFQDSRTIFDRSGAENLVGMGDMLFLPNGAADPTRVQCAYVDKNEVERVVNYIKDNNDCEFDPAIEDEMFSKKTGGAEFGSEDDYDPLLKDACRAAIRANDISASKIQRLFSVGWPKAGKIIDQMESLGFISPANSKNKREIFITDQEFEEKFGEEL